jgi:transposase
MIAATPATRVFLFEGAVDMRKGFEGLSALVRDKLGEDPISGHLFVFSNAARNRLKILLWDGSGRWGCRKRLEGGRFCWPSGDDARS